MLGRFPQLPVLQIVFLAFSKGQNIFWQLSAAVAEPHVSWRGGRVWEGVSPSKILVEWTQNGVILHTLETILGFLLGSVHYLREGGGGGKT